MARVVGNYRCVACLDAVIDAINAGIHLGYREVFPYIRSLVCLLAACRYLQLAFREMLEVRYFQRLGGEVAKHDGILAICESPGIDFG